MKSPADIQSQPRNPTTEAGKALLDRFYRLEPTSAEAIEGRRTLVERVCAIEEQAATEARRELLAKVEGLRREYVALPEEGADAIDAMYGDLFNRIAGLIESKP